MTVPKLIQKNKLISPIPHIHIKENKVKSKNIFGYSKTNSYSYIKDIDISSPKVKVISDICVDLNEKDYD